jgi:hypothetical protein
MRPAGRPASLLSLAGFRNRARDRAAARPGRGPAAGGDSICTKMFVVGLAVAIVFFTPSTSCDRPLRPWLLVFAAGLASYVGGVRGLFLALRPRHQELQETLAYAVYLLMYPLSFTWLVTGSVFVFRGFSSDCDSSILYITSIVICLISILYVALLAIFVSCATALSCCLSPASTARGLSNVMRNRLPNAAPASALRSLQPLPSVPFAWTLIDGATVSWGWIVSRPCRTFSTTLASSFGSVGAPPARCASGIFRGAKVAALRTDLYDRHKCFEQCSVARDGAVNLG